VRPPVIRLRLFVALSVIVISACAPFVLVPPERQTVGGVISVQPGVKWNRLVQHNFRGRVELWTLDGPGLNTLLFFTGVPDGEPLFTRASGAAETAQQEQPAVFRASMNPLEVQELLEATMARSFRTTIAEGRNLKAVPLANGQGFRFETRLIGRDEVERDGVFVGTIRGGRLYGAWFQGAKLHYFKRYLPEFDRIVASAQLVGDAAR
jgi:hypothetical protein